MKFLRDALDSVKPHFEKGGKWEKFFYIYEAHDTLLFAPKDTTKSKGVQIRDAIDTKRLMMTVIISLLPCLLFAIYNTGLQHFLAIGQPEVALTDIAWIGLIKVIPIVVVSYASGLTVEFIFATIRRHEVAEGFLVSGMLIPLVMPPDIPLWQVALATVFAVIIAKEAFGGTGMNILNVALTARAFLYFAYPGDISGDVWSYIGTGNEAVVGFSGATPLSIGAEAITTGENVVASLNAYGSGWADGLFSLSNLFMGFYPGSIGATSVLMCLIGAVILIITGTGNWKIIFKIGRASCRERV